MLMPTIKELLITTNHFQKALTRHCLCVLYGCFSSVLRQYKARDFNIMLLIKAHGMEMRQWVYPHPTLEICHLLSIPMMKNTHSNNKLTLRSPLPNLEWQQQDPREQSFLHGSLIKHLLQQVPQDSLMTSQSKRESGKYASQVQLVTGAATFRANCNVQVCNCI